MEKFTREQLDAKSIFEMRDLAKELGVSSPTKKKKGELVDIVFNISNGTITPPEAPRRGRPKKDDYVRGQTAETAEAKSEKL